MDGSAVRRACGGDGCAWVLKFGEECDGLGQNEGSMNGNVPGMLELRWEAGLAGTQATDGE